MHTPNANSSSIDNCSLAITRRMYAGQVSRVQKISSTHSDGECSPLCDAMYSSSSSMCAGELCAPSSTFLLCSLARLLAAAWPVQPLATT